MFSTISGLQTVDRDKPAIGHSTGPNGVDMPQQFLLSRSSRLRFQHLLTDCRLDTIASYENVTAGYCIVTEAQLQ